MQGHAQGGKTGAAAPFPANLPALTTVRFALALGVVLFHYQMQWPWRTSAVTGVLDNAWLAVDVFFILSGFVLTHAYRDEIASGRLDYRRFIVARVARIYPTHLAVMGFVIALVVAAAVIGAEFNHSFYDLKALIPTLLLIHAWFPWETSAQWNGPSWSLSAEWFAYLAFPAFAWIGWKLRNRPYLLMGVGVLAFIAADNLYQLLFGELVTHAQVRLGILRIVPEFLIGVALYRIGQTIQPSRIAAAAAASVSAILLLAFMHFRVDDRLVVAASGALVLTLALLSKAQADGWLAKPWMLAAGEASYALYLAHMPILIAWKGGMAALGDKPSSYVFAAWEVPALLATTLAAAFALHRFLEVPARRWIRSLGDSRRTEAQRSSMKAGSQPPDV